MMAKRVEVNTEAPDFALEDFQGHTVRLSDYRGERHVVLVLNRGFM
jgi:peroxiredoxin